jgi:transcriptional regulator with XRE-family HTH domain
MKKRLNLGEKIRYARNESGLSQKELATKLQLSDKAISAYEVGRAQPSVEILRDIGQATGRNVKYFIDDEGIEEMDFVFKIKKIEAELAEIKQALKKKGYQL